jgi:hypothetical protein
MSGNELEQVLSAHLDTLAISSQGKQGITPALLGIAKLAEGHVQAHGCVHLTRSISIYLFCSCVFILC